MSEKEKVFLHKNKLWGSKQKNKSWDFFPIVTVVCLHQQKTRLRLFLVKMKQDISQKTSDLREQRVN